MGKNSQAKESLRTTGIVGGGQVLNIILGLIKTKVAAILLGPAGIGLIGLFLNAVDTIKTISGLGLSFSGVRDIAIAKQQNDTKALAEILGVFLKWSFFLAVLGLLLIIFAAEPLGSYIFKSTEYTLELRILGIAVLFNILSASFSAALQGMGEISKMVIAGIFSNAVQTVFSVLLYYVFAEKAIVPVIIVSSVINFGFSFFYYKKINIPPEVWTSLKESFPKAKSMIKIGLFTVIVAVFDQIVALYLKSYFAGKSGIAAVGIFTTVLTVGGMYLSLVMSAVGTEYYPRLSSIHNDNVKVNEALNTQVDILLILAIPLIVTMLIFSDFVISILYSKEFLPASSILQWYFIGDVFKIISWPCGFIILAKGLGKVYIWMSIMYTVVSTLTIIVFYPIVGMQIVGISFATSQFLFLIVNYYFVFKKFDIKLSKSNIIQSLLLIISTIGIFILVRMHLTILTALITAMIYIVILILSASQLKKIIDIKSILKKVWK